MNDDYVRKLENVIRQMLTPLRGLPLSLVIQTLSGHKVIPFNSADPKDRSLLDKLKIAAMEAGLAGCGKSQFMVMRMKQNLLWYV